MLILTCLSQLQRLEEALRRSLPLALPRPDPALWKPANPNPGRLQCSQSQASSLPLPSITAPVRPGHAHLRAAWLEATPPLPSPSAGPMVYGAVLNINRGNPGELEVVVDVWPNFGAILARRRGEIPVDDCYSNTQAAFYRDVGAYRALLETPGCLRWDTAFHILGLQEGVATVSQAIAGTKGVELEVSDYYTYLHPDPSTLPEPRLAPGVRVGTLSPAHVDLLNETWPYGGNVRSRRYLGELLGRYPHVCLQDGARDPLSWTLTDHFGAGTHGYTLPGHRRHGHMRAVLSLAARRAQARGFPTFGHTATGNRPMQRLQEELGHQRLPGLCHFVLHNPGLARAGR
ncbi:glycine N-acyltransferase-like protein 3 [Alca torda]